MLTNDSPTRTRSKNKNNLTKQYLDPRCTVYARTNAGTKPVFTRESLQSSAGIHLALLLLLLLLLLLHVRGGRNFRPSLVVWSMQSCNGRQAVMSELEALVLAGKGLNAFSVLFY
jgi:hypothetical protein